MHPTQSFETSVPIPGTPVLHPSMPEKLASVHYQRTREMTIDELLLENRVVFLIGDINYSSAARIIMQMLYLENQKGAQDINFYINSPGGSVDDTLAIYDTMRFISSEIATYCIGRAYSGGAVLLCAGEDGKRNILPHAQVMIHQPYGGITGRRRTSRFRQSRSSRPSARWQRSLRGIPVRMSRKSWRMASGTSTSPHRKPRITGLVDEVFEHSDKNNKKKKGS